MKRVEWWIVKVYQDRRPGENPIDLWCQYETERKAFTALRQDGPDTPFSVAKVTCEIIRKPSRKR